MDVDKKALALRLMAIQGSQCAMPGCTERWKDPAHIEGSGMGGRPSTYVIENMVGLCRADHDIFDGRVMQGRGHMLRVLMSEVVKQQRKGLT